MDPQPGAPFDQQPRTFNSEELACFARRGGRLSQAEWLRLGGFEGPIVAYYERATGLPFCRADLAVLGMALTITNSFKVLRAIRESAQVPVQSPGFFLIKDGFAAVTGLIDRRADLQPRASLKKGESAGSGLTPEIAQHIRERKRRRIDR